MTLAELLILVVIAFVAGALGQALSGFYVGGCLVSTLLGFVGAFVGAWLARQFNLPDILVITVGDEAFPIVWSVVGAGILSVIAGLVMGPPRRLSHRDRLAGAAHSPAPHLVSALQRGARLCSPLETRIRAPKGSRPSW